MHDKELDSGLTGQLLNHQQQKLAFGVERSTAKFKKKGNRQNDEISEVEVVD